MGSGGDLPGNLGMAVLGKRRGSYPTHGPTRPLTCSLAPWQGRAQEEPWLWAQPPASEDRLVQ